MSIIKIKQSDIPAYKIVGEVYSLVSSFCTTDEKIALAAFARLYEMMKYYAGRYDVSFLVALSNIDGRGAYKKRIKRRGNPKIQVLGKKVPYHAHAVIVGKRAGEFTKEIVRRRNKADGKKLTKRKRVKDLGRPSEVAIYDGKGMEIIDYICEQSIVKRSYPKDGFDFERFIGEFYRIEQD